jgi:hypothetical protein
MDGEEFHGINNHGDIAGFASPSLDIIHGFVLHDGVYSRVDAPGAVMTELEGINDRDQLVGTAVLRATSYGFLATPVPEPGSLFLIVSGAASLAMVLRRRWPRVGDC